MKIFIITMLLAITVVATADKRCRRQDDCEEDECCVQKVIGLFRRGHCQKLAAEGEECSDRDDKIELFGDRYIAHCPCSEGLTCEPEEEKDWGIFGKIKLGEKCVAQTTTSSPEVTTEAEVVEPEVTDAPAEE